MNGQQINALLGKWYDIVGRGGHRHTAMPPGTVPWRLRRHRWQDQQGFNDGFGDYGGGASGGVDQPALWTYLQQLQQQILRLQPAQQVPVAVPVAVPAAPAAPPATSGWIGAEPSPFPFPPRAAVVDAPLPTQANRDILPMSTGVPILPTQSAQITGRPQTLVYKIGRFVISNAGTAGGAADWIVNDIKIGNVSQFVQSGDVPGDMFATNAIDTFVRFAPAQTAMDVVVVVTYIGLNESGCPFFGAMVGTAAV